MPDVFNNMELPEDYIYLICIKSPYLHIMRKNYSRDYDEGEKWGQGKWSRLK